MAVTMFEISLPVFVRHLEGLSIVLKKAQALYSEKKYDETTLMSYRLYSDMFNLARQVQAATDHARNCIVALRCWQAWKHRNGSAKAQLTPG